MSVDPRFDVGDSGVYLAVSFFGRVDLRLGFAGALTLTSDPAAAAGEGWLLFAFSSDEKAPAFCAAVSGDKVELGESVDLGAGFFNGSSGGRHGMTGGGSVIHIRVIPFD